MILICAAAIMAIMAMMSAVVMAAIGGIYHACKVNRGYTAIG